MRTIAEAFPTKETGGSRFHVLEETTIDGAR